MIYLFDDYLEKYISVFSYLIERATFEKFSFSYIEKNIAYSDMVNELERSNIVTIAFSSKERIYATIFPENINKGFKANPYNEFGWLGYLYVHLFLKLQITFETIFIILPIKEALKMYHLYHEMDIRQSLDYVKSLVKFSYFDSIMKSKKVSSKELAEISGVSLNTIKALRFNNRDINKIEARTMYRLSQALNIKSNSLLTSLELKTSI